jgi:hypothetical protein
MIAASFGVNMGFNLHPGPTLSDFPMLSITSLYVQLARFKRAASISPAVSNGPCLTSWRWRRK